MRRAAWRVVSTVERRENDKEKSELIRNYKADIEKELEDICADIIGTFNLLAYIRDFFFIEFLTSFHLIVQPEITRSCLIPNAKSEEGKVFYFKMKGDYFRYLAEFQTEDKRKESASKALEDYEQASKIAEMDLAPTNPIRLGLALNFSVFYYEIINSPERACQLAKQVHSMSSTNKYSFHALSFVFTIELWLFILLSLGI